MSTKSPEVWQTEFALTKQPRSPSESAKRAEDIARVFQLPIIDVAASLAHDIDAFDTDAQTVELQLSRSSLDMIDWKEGEPVMFRHFSPISMVIANANDIRKNTVIIQVQGVPPESIDI